MTFPKCEAEAKEVIKKIHSLAPIPWEGQSCNEFYLALQESGNKANVWCLLNQLYAWANVADPRSFIDQRIGVPKT